ncbi:uncharacterized protein CEXT_365261 [Caerostris extrusa]|uniref:Uncharacterized protein n=1 Tax=Caerostris extrusa TaxID=172846 RepID=A0AAV4Q8M1_CAEEX|nr:uncharacterized protein CEXT_365261 [Caerostris extrusa]
MLKLLLSHWQAHREPLPFVLTDDPLYCSHLTKSPFPEVYSVNRVNPIFEDEEHEDAKSVVSSHIHLKRSLSEERRENETRASDDTGYSSSSHFKSVTTADSLTDDVGSLEARHMSSDSDEYSQPEEVVVSVDVHRVSYPEDVIVLSSNSSNCSHTYSANSYSSHCEGGSDSSQEPFDSLTMSSTTEDRSKNEGRRPNSLVREKLQKLLERGNEQSAEMFLDSLEAKPSTDREIEKTKSDLMKSLTRALHNKVPNKGEAVVNETVTRTDSALDDQPQTRPKSLDRKSTSSSTSPKTLYFSQSSSQRDSNGVTRQDESSASSSISFKPRKHRSKHPSEKESKRNSTTSNQESTDSKKSHDTHKCKLCENAHRPLAFHQLLPGHWSYDNVYLPQISGMCYSCMHHHHHGNSFLPSSDDDVFYPMYYPPDVARARHSWAPYTNSRILLENPPKRKRASEDKSYSTSQKGTSKEGSNTRYSPDGSSRETDSSDSNPLKKSLSERRSLREPKKCKCEHCLESALDKDGIHPPHMGSHTCPCHCLSHRRVKFASDTDVSQHRHMHSVPFRLGKDGEKLVNGEPINAAFVMSLPHLNGHALSNSQGIKENGLKSKMSPPLIPRGLKEPIKMDELYRSYPINFRDWEAHYRRSYLQKKKRKEL